MLHDVIETSARLLRLLSLLQSPRTWSGPELAERLGITTRTVRRDVDRLRRLGYPVDAAPGVVGGYRLGVGANVPPLLLDDDEATAAVVALDALARGGAGGTMAESALAALAKLDRTLPDRLRHRVLGLRRATEHLPRGDDPVVPGVLTLLAAACAGHDLVRMGYVDREGRASERRVEPHRLVATGRRWYLVARDVDRARRGDPDGGWRTFRLDRVGEVEATGHRFTPSPDAPDATVAVQLATSSSPYRFQAVVRYHAPAEVVRPLVPATAGVVEPDGDDACLLRSGGDHLAWMGAHLVALDLPFEVLGPPELVDWFDDLHERLTPPNRV